MVISGRAVYLLGPYAGSVLLGGFGAPASSLVGSFPCGFHTDFSDVVIKGNRRVGLMRSFFREWGKKSCAKVGVCFPKK